jgi:hypothetical protein
MRDIDKNTTLNLEATPESVAETRKRSAFCNPSLGSRKWTDACTHDRGVTSNSLCLSVQDQESMTINAGSPA